MVNERALQALEWVVRGVGVVVFLVGSLLARSVPVYGVPVALLGLALAVWPAVVGELLGLVADLL
ncbi:hypothetical protein [Halorarius halobius]|uniref:hypothetical protein n=1 Tax=Halorarius halobius TaxID=2962671 RepID=UPI0020CF1559|nr:hypothetical protein [Halorarius halobius]